jgi:hypothetical protein
MGVSPMVDVINTVYILEDVKPRWLVIAFLNDSHNPFDFGRKCLIGSDPGVRSSGWNEGKFRLLIENITDSIVVQHQY